MIGALVAHFGIMGLGFVFGWVIYVSFRIDAEHSAIRDIGALFVVLFGGAIVGCFSFLQTEAMVGLGLYGLGVLCGFGTGFGTSIYGGKRGVCAAGHAQHHFGVEEKHSLAKNQSETRAAARDCLETINHVLASINVVMTEGSKDPLQGLVSAKRELGQIKMTCLAAVSIWDLTLSEASDLQRVLKTGRQELTTTADQLTKHTADRFDAFEVITRLKRLETMVAQYTQLTD